MTPTTTKSPPKSDAEKEARARVREIKDFYNHLTIFMLVNMALIGVWFFSGGSHFWPIYPLFGWGIGLGSHAANTFGFAGKFDKSWEEQKVRELMLQQEHGLDADEVKALLRKEMSTLASSDELNRINNRLENLEAIVTSRDWDELPTHSEVLQVDADEDRASVDSENAAADAARLARRVR